MMSSFVARSRKIFVLEDFVLIEKSGRSESLFSNID